MSLLGETSNLAMMRTLVRAQPFRPSSDLRSVGWWPRDEGNALGILIDRRTVRAGMEVLAS